MIRSLLTVLFVIASLNISAGELTWTTAGPETGRVTVVRFDPLAPNVVWVGTVGHGVFRSTDGGATWAPMNNSLDTGSVGAIAIDPNNSSNLLVGHYNIYHTNDGGTHWVVSEEGLLPGVSRITSLAVDPSRPSNVYVSTTRDVFNPSAGVQKSIDGGETWFDSGKAGLSTKDVLALVLDRQHPSTLFAGGMPDYLGRPMFKSADGGTTWFAISSGLLAEDITSIGIDPLTGNTLFASQAGALMRSNDAGASWALDGSGVPSSCCTAIVYERNSSTNIWLATFDDVYHSTNGGVSWTPSKIGNERVSALDLNAEGALVAGTENDGLFRRSSSTAPWLASNSGLFASDGNAVAADQSHAGTLYVGTADTGLFKSIDHAHSWQRLSPDFLGLWIVAVTIDPKNSSTVYVGTGGNGSSFYKSTDAGATWSSPSSLRGAYEIVIDPSASDTLYVGTSRGVSKSTNGGASFTSVSKGLPSFTVFDALAIDPSDPMTLYTGGLGSGLYKTTDGGANWTKKLGQVSIGAIVVDRTNPATVFMTTSNGLLKSTDRGETWIESDSGIPTKTTGALWIDPLDGRRLYTGTPLNGVFRSNDGGATWTKLGGVSPAELIYSIAVEPGGNVVHAGASGGVFSYQFTGSGTVVRRRGTSH